MGKLGESIESIYARHPQHILPFIGDAFERPDESKLRVMTVGINAYISPKDWIPRENKPEPKWFRDWFAKSKHPFDRGVLREARPLAGVLTADGSLHAGKALCNLDSFFHTDAIKVYLPIAEGKRAADLTDAHFERHMAQWRDELDAMASHGALPHVIAIYGAPFWKRAWSSFHQGVFARFKVLRYQSADGPSLHYSNRVVVESKGGEHHIALVRLRHPSARTQVGSAAWLASKNDFRRLFEA